jgi:hypothetical protein
MHTTNAPAHHDGAFTRTARAVGRWFSRTANALATKREPDSWMDWPRFPPF